MNEPFFRQPRWLANAVDRGDLTFFQHSLLCYLGGKGLGYHGATTTLAELAAVTGKTDKWCSETLRKLRAARLIEYELRQGQRRQFIVEAGPALTSSIPAAYFDPEATSEPATVNETPPERTSELTSELDPSSEFRGHFGTHDPAEDAQRQEGSGIAPDPDIGTSRARVDGDVETKTNDSVMKAGLVAGVGEGTSDEDELPWHLLARRSRNGDEPTLDDALRDPALFEIYVAPFGKLVEEEDEL